MGLPEKADFFETISQQGVALTYDDVRIRTGPSQVSPSEVSIESKFSTNVELRTPIVSAAMDTVTTSDMAIAMAKLGGLGIIHAGFGPKEQRDEVRRVKLHLNGLIERPITVSGDSTMGDVIKMCDERDFDFRTFPVLDNDERFIGLLTQNDFDFSNDDRSAVVSNVMTPIKEVISAESGMDVNSAYSLMKDAKKKTLPLIDKDGRVTGLYVFADARRLVEGNPDKYNLDKNGRLIVGAAVPTDEEALTRIEGMLQYLDVAVIDSAQGDSKFAFQTLKSIKEQFPNLDVVVGNISAAESATLLEDAGADGIKVGQGPGSICTTRVVTGIGCPQVTAVWECSKGVNVPVCADGGITNPGDISIAIAAGASSVMMGRVLAGTDESPGQIITREGKQYVFFRGMGSPSAIRDSAASQKRYGAEEGQAPPLSEGVETYVPYVGSVGVVVDNNARALRKSMSYCGAPDIETHKTKTGLFRITNAGLRESHPHDIEPISIS